MVGVKESNGSHDWIGPGGKIFITPPQAHPVSTMLAVMGELPENPLFQS